MLCGENNIIADSHDCKDKHFFDNFQCLGLFSMISVIISLNLISRLKKMSYICKDIMIRRHSFIKYITSMKKFHFAILWIALLLLSSCSDQTPHLLIVHTNDTHSQIDAAPANDPYTPGQGGMVQRGAIMEAMRAQDPSLLYFDGGDMVQGSPYFNVYKGIMEMKAMNIMGLKASTFGNHEFDNGIDFLVEMLKVADFPIVSCNLDCSQTPLAPYVKRSIVFTHNGVKIGVTGATLNPEGLVFMKNIAGVVYTDPAVSVHEETQNLKEQGCDLIILLSHNGYADKDNYGDRRIAAHSRYLDLIIGGHTHSNLENGEVAPNLDGRNVMITQTGGRCNPMGAINIEMMKDTIAGSKARWMVKSIECSKLHPESLQLEGYGQSMEEFVSPYRTELEATMQQKLGYAPETMDKGRPQGLLGNFTADALRYMGELKGGKAVDVAIMNNGGLRSTINRGDVTLGDIYSVYPFENTLTLIDLKGEDLDKLVRSLAGRGLEALSGLEVTLGQDGDKTVARKILVGGKKIQPNHIYRIATIDYLAEGNGGMMALTRGTIENTGILLRDMMTEYVTILTREGKLIESQLDKRVVKQ